MTKAMKLNALFLLVFAFASVSAYAGGTDPYGNEDPNKKILKQGLLGAGVGAISAEASGGKAGTGALVGAGTNVIGGALLDTLTTPSQPQQPVYAQQPYYQQGPPPPAPTYVQQPQSYYDQPQPVYQQAPQAYYPPQEDPNKKILKQGLLGAGTGAIAASASGGSAGKGALIGAGTNIIGGALLDTLTAPSQPRPQPVYYQQQQQQPQSYYQQQGSQQTAPKKKIIRKYDAEGKIVSEEEFYE